MVVCLQEGLCGSVSSGGVCVVVCVFRRGRVVVCFWLEGLCRQVSISQPPTHLIPEWCDTSNELDFLPVLLIFISI